MTKLKVLACKPTELIEHYGMGVEGIVDKIRKILVRKR